MTAHGSKTLRTATERPTGESRLYIVGFVSILRRRADGFPFSIWRETMSRRLLPVGVLMVLMSAGPLILPARAAEKLLVSDVIIQGNRRTSTEQIKVRLHTQAGKEYDP